MTATSIQQSGRLALSLPEGSLDDAQFAELCRLNPELDIERNAFGELLIMSPTGSKTGHWNSMLNGLLFVWNQNSEMGKTFDSSTGFRLPNGAIYGPDAAWVARARWEELSAAEQETFAPLAPDFVIELRSRYDDLGTLKAKVEEFMACGCRLAWLVDPYDRMTWVYEVEKTEPSAVPFVEELDGGEVLPGFAVCMAVVLE